MISFQKEAAIGTNKKKDYMYCIIDRKWIRFCKMNSVSVLQDPYLYRIVAFDQVCLRHVPENITLLDTFSQE